MTKVAKVTAVTPPALKAAQERAEQFEARYWAEQRERVKLQEELRSARDRIDELSRECDAARNEAGHHLLEVRRLEGYRQRVERVDDLDRGIPPMQHFSGDGAATGVDLGSYRRERGQDGNLRRVPR